MMNANAAAKYLAANLTGARLFQLDFTVGAFTANAADKTASVRRARDSYTITGIGAEVVVPADGSALFATLTMLCGSDKVVRRAVSQWSDLY